MGRPTIDIIFKQLAVSAVERSARGIVALIIKDDTDKTFKTKEYKLATDIETALFTTANVQAITDCFSGTPAKVIVVRVDATGGTIADALTIAAGLKFNWIGAVSSTQADHDAIATWIKAQDVLKKTFKAVTYKAISPDSKRVVNLVNDKVTFADTRGQKTGDSYVPTLLGILAGLSLNRSATYYKCTTLTSVIEPADIDASINLGNLVLFNDSNYVKIAAAVTSLVTITSSNTADMQQITTIEEMDIITGDISTTFADNWVGNYKNKYDNQVLLISAIKSYFKTLEDEQVLDNGYANTLDIDVAAQKLAWQATGKDVSAWTDLQTKHNTFRRSVFLLGDIKLLGAVENLSFAIQMF